MKRLTIALLLLCLCSCAPGHNAVTKCRKIDMIYNFLIVRELHNSKGVNYTKIDSLDKERERKIKLNTKI